MKCSNKKCNNEVETFEFIGDTKVSNTLNPTGVSPSSIGLCSNCYDFFNEKIKPNLEEDKNG